MNKIKPWVLNRLNFKFATLNICVYTLYWLDVAVVIISSEAAQLLHNGAPTAEIVAKERSSRNDFRPDHYIKHTTQDK